MKATTKAKKAVRIGNRIGKTQMGMDMAAAQRCDSTAKPRRSIPVDEVNKMIQHAIERVRSERTIYDDRATVLESLAVNEREIGHVESSLHQLRLQNKLIRSDLNQINVAITRQLELNTK